MAKRKRRKSRARGTTIPTASQIRQRAQEAAEKLEADLEGKLRELQQLLTKHNSLATFACFATNDLLIALQAGPDEFSDAVLRMQVLGLALLCLPSPQMNQAEDVLPAFSDDPLLCRIEGTASELAVLLGASTGVRAIAEYEDAEESILAAMSVGENLFMTGIASHTQLREWAKRLYGGDLEPVFSSELGFTVDQAFELFDHFTQAISSTLNLVGATLLEQKEASIAEIKRALEEPTHSMHARLGDLLRNRGMSAEEYEVLRSGILLRSALAVAAWHDLDELSQRSGLAPDIIEAILAVFAVDLESDKQRSLTYEGVLSNPLAERPIVRHGGSIIVPCPTLLFQVFLERLDGVLVNRLAVRDAYERQKKTVSESFLKEVLVPFFGNENTFVRLHYPFEGKAAEADALVLYDHHLLAIELKAGLFRTPIEEVGTAERVISDYDSKVGAAIRQARRTIAYIDSAEEVTFYRTASLGQAVLTVRRSDLDRRFAVAVTGGWSWVRSSASKLLETSGILSYASNEWTVSLHDLETLLQYLETPEVFFHYLSYRLAFLSNFAVTGVTEYESLGTYLKDGYVSLRWWLVQARKRRPSTAFFDFSEHRQDLDAHDACLRGEGHEVPKPRRSFTRLQDIVLKYVLDKQIDRRTEIVGTILGCPLVKDPSMDKALDVLASRAQSQDGTDISFWYEDSLLGGRSGVTLWAGTSALSAARARAYVVLKKYQCRCDTWTLLLFDGRGQDLVDVAFLSEPWEADAELEAEVKRLLRKRPTSPETGRPVKVGRNDPCPCGSGRKYKACCMRIGL